MNVSYLVNDNFITVVVNNKPYTISKNDENFEIVKTKLRNKDYDDIEEYLSNLEILKKKFKTTSGLKIVENEIFYNGEKLHGSLINQIIFTKNDGFEFDNLVKFLENLMESNSFIQSELYDWIEASGRISITHDGAFLAYKKVNHEYFDLYTKSIDNSVGKIVELPREKVDPNRKNECSYGLHFCAYDYLNHYGTSNDCKVVVVKIFPQDVIAIPVDYNFQKGRCCKYEVVGEILDWKNTNDLLTKTVADYSDSENVKLIPECSCGDDCMCDEESNVCSDCGYELEDCICCDMELDDEELNVCPDCGYELDECNCCDVDSCDGQYNFDAGPTNPPNTGSLILDSNLEFDDEDICYGNCDDCHGCGTYTHNTVDQLASENGATRYIIDDDIPVKLPSIETLKEGLNTLSTNKMTKIYNEFYKKSINHLKTKRQAIDKMIAIFEKDSEFILSRI